MQSQEFEPISRAQLTKRMNDIPPENVDPDRGYALVNVLEKDAYAKEHIPASINIPIGDEREFQKRFSKHKDIVVYCASSTCDASPKVANKLVRMGFTNVYDYEAGLSDWKGAGGPVESGSPD